MDESIWMKYDLLCICINISNDTFMWKKSRMFCWFLYSFLYLGGVLVSIFTSVTKRPDMNN